MAASLAEPPRSREHAQVEIEGGSIHRFEVELGQPVPEGRGPARVVAGRRARGRISGGKLVRGHLFQETDELGQGASAGDAGHGAEPVVVEVGTQLDILRHDVAIQHADLRTRSQVDVDGVAGDEAGSQHRALMVADADVDGDRRGPAMPVTGHRAGGRGLAEAHGQPGEILYQLDQLRGDAAVGDAMDPHAGEDRGVFGWRGDRPAAPRVGTSVRVECQPARQRQHQCFTRQLGLARMVDQVGQGAAGTRTVARYRPEARAQMLIEHQRDGADAVDLLQRTLVEPGDVGREPLTRARIDEGKTHLFAAEEDAAESARADEVAIGDADLVEAAADGLEGDFVAPGSRRLRRDGGMPPDVREHAAVEVDEGRLGAAGAEIDEQVRVHHNPRLSLISCW